MATSKKIERALYGPSWTEVILGAALSLALGVVLGVVFLVLKPVVTVTESKMPKEEERVRGAVYYIEGGRDSAKSRDAVNKRTAFLSGKGVTVNEDELNVALGAAAPGAAAAPKAPPAKGKDGKDTKAAEAAPAAGGGLLTPGTPNFRIVDGRMQIAVPTTLNVMGLTRQVVVMGDGTFAKSGDVVVFVPEEFHVGSLNTARLPFVQSYILGKVMTAKPPPEDLAAAWAKVTDATITGRSLTLTTQ